MRLQRVLYGAQFGKQGILNAQILGQGNRTILRAFFSSQQRQDCQTIFIVLLPRGVIAVSGNATV
jgi:hypothetical protein